MSHTSPTDAPFRKPSAADRMMDTMDAITIPRIPTGSTACTSAGMAVPASFVTRRA